MKTLIATLVLLTSSVAFAAPVAKKAIPAATAKAPAPTGIETATCVDGKTYYHLTGEHRGACSGHGGVASWTDGSPVKSKGGKATSYR